MEDKKVVLISLGGFLSITVKEAFKKKHIETIDIRPNIIELDNCKDESNVFLVILGDFPSNSGSMFERLKEICWNKKYLFVLGESIEIKELKKTIPAAIITKEFVRPFNTTDIVSIIARYFSIDSENVKMREILVIDDDSTFLWMISGCLSDTYVVKVATSGMEGFTIMSQSKPDLILLDYEMPIADGETVAQMLAAENDTKDIPVIFLTGKDDKETVMKLLKLHPAGYLLKTLTSDDIHRAVDDFFAKTIIDET